jgi:FtsH-binding integral membrane protein
VGTPVDTGYAETIGKNMIWKSIWHITSTELLARIVFAVLAATLASLGIASSSPWLSCVAVLCLMVLIYRLRYRRV